MPVLQPVYAQLPDTQKTWHLNETQNARLNDKTILNKTGNVRGIFGNLSTVRLFKKTKIYTLSYFST